MEQSERCVFAITEDKSTVIIGIHEKAYEFMKTGKTHTFDLRQFGVPVKLMLYGGQKTQEEAKAVLNITPDTLDVSGLDVGFGRPDE